MRFRHTDSLPSSASRPGWWPRASLRGVWRDSGGRGGVVNVQAPARPAHSGDLRAEASNEGGRVFELAVRAVRMPVHDAFPAMVVLGPPGRAHACVLAVRVSASETQVLLDELRGGRAARDRVAAFLGRLAANLGHRLVLRLVPAARGGVMAEPESEPPIGARRVPIEPGRAIVAAVQLGVPLLAEASLLREGEPVELPGLAAFVEYLELER